MAIASWPYHHAVFPDGAVARTRLGLDYTQNALEIELGAADATILAALAAACAERLGPLGLAGREPRLRPVAVIRSVLAEREVLKVHPRSDPARPLTGVFATRSPDRPNPLGLHPVTVRAIEPGRLRVGPIEAIDGAPVVDLKPLLRCQPRET